MNLHSLFSLFCDKLLWSKLLLSDCPKWLVGTVVGGGQGEVLHPLPHQAARTQVTTPHRPLAPGREVRLVEALGAVACPGHLLRHLVGVPVLGHRQLVGVRHVEVRHTEALQGDAPGPVEGVQGWLFQPV